MKQIYKANKNYIKLLLCLIFIALILVAIYILNINEQFYRYNDNNNDDNDIQINKGERTKLYGSLFLDNLEGVIKNMSNPSINYNTKRLENIKYSDILL